MPLSAGRILANDNVECPYHGWRFKKDGRCSKIPSLTGHEDLEEENIRVRSYPVREQDGLIWVYMAAKPGAEPENPNRRASGCVNAIPCAGPKPRPSAAASIMP